MDFTELNKLLEALPGYSLLTDSMKTSALMGALIPDEAGRWPSNPEYVPTYDVYFAALSLLPFLQSQPVVTSASSEGTSVSVQATDWNSIRAFYRGLSPICSTNGNDVLQIVPIPDVPHVRRVPMNDRGGYYGDVDTDLG